MDSKTYNEWLFSYEEDLQIKLIPAATVILLRDNVVADKKVMEVLLVKRNPELKFVGGAWVFPGGKIDAEDFDAPKDLISASYTAAIRETQEETNLEINRDDLVQFSHWVPPPVLPKLFATWFFLASAPKGEVIVDGGEICDYAWLTPSDAIAKRDAEEMEFAPPTFITLNELTQYGSTAEAVKANADKTHLPFYATRIANTEKGTFALWEGDAGYEDYDPEVEGSRHRLEISKKIWKLEDTPTKS